MNQAESFFVQGHFSARTVIDSLLRAGVFEEFVLYEHAGEARIAGGVHRRLQVIGDEIVLQGQALQAIREPTKDPIADVERLLGKLDMAAWTAYGYIGFDIVRFYSDYMKSTKTPSLDLIIPEIDIRITEKGMTICGPVDRRLLVESDRNAPRSKTEQAYQVQPLELDDQIHYESAVERIKDAIGLSELRKAIVSRRVKMKGTLDVLGTYEAASVNNAARSYCFKLDPVRGVGSSPELLLESDGKGNVMTAPLAGTRPRGADSEKDARLRSELHSDPKEIMEHAISILLAQEELRSVCDADSVRITDFMEVKQFRCVQHLSSRVFGKLRNDKNVWDAFRILFPGITVSGVPKSSALRWIDRVEEEARGVYAGSVGWIDSNGVADMAIALRSVFEYDGQVQFNAGAGIVGDSNSRSEYFESVNKMNTMLERTVLREP